jgi:hypothetical protein
MSRKHSLDFKGITNVAHLGSIFIFVRHTQDLCRRFGRLVDSFDYCTPALFFRIVTPVLVSIGILAVMAMVVAVLYERVFVFLLVLRGIDDLNFV